MEARLISRQERDMDTTAAIKWKSKLRKVFVLQYNIELCDCTVGSAFPTMALSIQSFLCFINVLSIGSNSVGVPMTDF